MQLPEWLNWAALAVAQDLVLAKKFPTWDDAEELEKFKLLCEAQELIGPTNLTVRRHLIRAALGAPGELEKAWKQFEALCAHEIYMEGPSYWLYVKTAFDFYARLAGRLPNKYDEELGFTAQSFFMLAAPDGTVSLSETRDTDKFPFITLDGGHSWPGHTVTRRKGSFLLIEHEPKILDYHHNFHVNPSFGHFAFYKAGQGWLALCPPYTGFQDKRSRPNAEAAYVNVPRGAWNDSYWRLKGGPFKVLERSETLVHLSFGRKWCCGMFGQECERIFEIGGSTGSPTDSVTIIDIGDGFTNLLTPPTTCFEILGGKWTHEVENGFVRWTGTGAMRKMRFVF